MARTIIFGAYEWNMVFLWRRKSNLSM